MSSRYRRLSPIDHLMLRTETDAAPTHVGGLCILKAGSELEDLGRLKAALLPRALASPELHSVVSLVPPLCGRPLWVDDPAFSIDRHVYSAAVPPPGDERSLLDTAVTVLRPQLDRSKPLWEVWLLTGLQGGRIGLLFKIHHAVADGMAAVRLVATLIDDRLAPQRPIAAGAPAGPPGFGRLLADNVASRLTALARPLGHPICNARAAVPALAYSLKEMRAWNAAPRTSFNRVVGPERQLRILRMDLEAARLTAHAHAGKINDVVLAVVAGGMATVLRHRGEVVDGDLIAAVAVNLRESGPTDEAGNVVGAFRVHLPIGLEDPGELLTVVARRMSTAKATQRVSRQSSNLALGFVGWLATLGVSFANRQRMINLFVSNVQGPPAPLRAFGTEVEEVIPITALFGNETVSFLAMSYCGQLNLITVAEATAWPDVDLLCEGMAEVWEAMAGQPQVSSA